MLEHAAGLVGGQALGARRGGRGQVASLFRPADGCSSATLHVSSTFVHGFFIPFFHATTWLKKCKKIIAAMAALRCGRLGARSSAAATT